MKDLRFPIYKRIILIIVGIIFLYSAISKLISIDAFEVYVYSFGFFSLDLTFLLARLLISFELGLGLWLITGLHRKVAVILSSAMLLGFNVLLAYLLLSDSSEHCHCFGEAIVLSHYESLIKNLIFLVLLVVTYKGIQYKFRFGIISLAIIAIASTAIPLMVSTPDSWMQSQYAEKSTYNEVKLTEYIQNNSNLQEGKQLLCFYGASCRFCKLSSKKIEVIKSKVGHPEFISYHFWGTDEKIEKFKELTLAKFDNYNSIEAGEFLKITDGKMPLIVLLENGKVVSKFGYRDFDEQVVINFLK